MLLSVTTQPVINSEKSKGDGAVGCADAVVLCYADPALKDVARRCAWIHGEAAGVDDVYASVGGEVWPRAEALDSQTTYPAWPAAPLQSKHPVAPLPSPLLLRLPTVQTAQTHALASSASSTLWKGCAGGPAGASPMRLVVANPLRRLAAPFGTARA